MGRPITYVYYFLFFVFLTASPVAFGDNNPPPAETAPQSSSAAPSDEGASGGQRLEDLDVTFDINPRQENGKLYFDVETNLPDGMLFMCAIRDEIGVVYKMGSTMERLQAEVDGGKITLGPFPFEDRPFPSGEYTVYINSYPGQEQPPNVINIIGQDGSNLIGQNVFHGMVIFVKEFMITGMEG